MNLTPTPTTSGGICQAIGQEVAGGPDDHGPVPLEGGAGGVGPDSPDPGVPPGQSVVGTQKSDGYGVSDGIFAALNVVDPKVPHPSNDFLSQRILVKNCTDTSWLEIGWAEVGWRDDRQYIYTHDSVSNQFTFYDQFPISPGSRPYFELFDNVGGNTTFDAMVHWNGQWQTLKRVNLGSNAGCGVEHFVQADYRSTNRSFNFPPIEFGENHPNGVQVADGGTGQFSTWGGSFPTEFRSNDGYSRYTASYSTNWYVGWANSVNLAPVANVSVSPLQGNRSTSFVATASGSYDPNGDPVNVEIHWGDGRWTYKGGDVNGSASVKYQSTGSFDVRSKVCDQSTCTWSAPRTVQVSFSNGAPAVSLSLTPENQGDLATTFSAEVFAGDPENDPLTYAVDWGDGTITRERQSSHRYSRAGDYIVTATATDPYDASGTASRSLKVCVASTASDCPQAQPPPPPDPCLDTELECLENPLPATPLEELRTVSKAVRNLYTPDGEILVVDDNVLQIYANPTLQCSVGAPKDCNQRQREEAFAKAVKRLASKEPGTGRGDGMGSLPDVILLQEVGCHSGEGGACPNGPENDVVNIVAELRKLGYPYSIAAYRKAGHLIGDNGQIDGPGESTSVSDYCSGETTTPENKAKCEELIDVVADTAIIYNHETMIKIDGSVDYQDTTYTIDEKKPCPGDNLIAPRPGEAGFSDVDADEKDDCAMKWKRHYSTMFAERSTTLQGAMNQQPPSQLPPTQPPPPVKTGVKIAVSSVHTVPGDYFGDSAQGVARHAAAVDRWAGQLFRHLDRDYPGAETFGLGGDFNNRRCANKQSNDPRDYPGPPQTCELRDWWATLTDTEGQVDAVYEHNKGADDRLAPQYVDGCATALENGACFQPGTRTRRIDFIFTERGLAAASHDLSCGLVAGLNPANCDNLVSPQRYSDHRLVWMLLKFKVKAPGP